MKIIYSDKFDLKLGDHIFPSVKYRMTRDRLLAESICALSDILEPPNIDNGDVALVHTEEYIAKLKTGNLSVEEQLRMEVPYSRRLVEAVWICAGGVKEACLRALADRICVALCGGFHHAFADHGEGFCLLNDAAIAVRALQHGGRISRALVLDCDVHHGNGTAAIFRDDPSVFTFSIHQFHNYPLVKPPSDLDIDLANGTDDDEYLEKLEQGMRSALSEFEPDLIVYLAGADPYEEDQLGGLSLTLNGLRKRDRLVFETALSRGIPVAVTLAGGYAWKVEDTVSIHVHMVQEAIEAVKSVKAPIEGGPIEDRRQTEAANASERSGDPIKPRDPSLALRAPWAPARQGWMESPRTSWVVCVNGSRERQ